MYNYPNYYNYGGYIPQQQQQQIISSTLNGKVVDSYDVVKTQEIPFGGYGIYPKADGSSIYYKVWNNDGTTRIDEYKKVVTEPQYNVTINDLAKAIDDISLKIDNMQKQPFKKKENGGQQHE